MFNKVLASYQNIIESLNRLILDLSVSAPWRSDSITANRITPKATSKGEGGGGMKGIYISQAHFSAEMSANPDNYHHYHFLFQLVISTLSTLTKH